MATQSVVVATNVSSEGFLLLDSRMAPVFVNPIAAQILAYPQKPEAQKNLDGYLAARVRSTLIVEQPPNGSAIVARFQSGRRTYSCRSFPVNSMTNGHAHASLALILERGSARPSPVANLFQRFNLTTREREVAQFLLQGLTSKEIGARMQISPNTVKAFLRLIMVKMGVSTRSGILGKAFTDGF